MNDDQLLRYSRHILLPQVGTEGQERLGQARVLVVGLGGLGSPAAIYLAASGVGHLVLADADRVELSNLQRQISHTTADIDQPKVASAQDRLRALNPEVSVAIHHERLEGDTLREAVAGVDLVVDATDNFPTRFALNAACVASGVPMVSGAAIRMEGQVSVFDSRRPDSACYRCLYHEAGGTEGEACSETGILAPVVGVIGAIQAVEAVKLIAGFGEPLHNRLLVFDAATMEWRTVRLRKDPQCPACGDSDG